MNYNLLREDPNLPSGIDENLLTEANQGYSWAPITPDMVTERIASLSDDPRMLALDLAGWCNKTQEDIIIITTEDGEFTALGGDEPEQHADYTYEKLARILTSAQRINDIVFGLVTKDPTKVGLSIKHKDPKRYTRTPFSGDQGIPTDPHVTTASQEPGLSNEESIGYGDEQRDTLIELGELALLVVESRKDTGGVLITTGSGDLRLQTYSDDTHGTRVTSAEGSLNRGDKKNFLLYLNEVYRGALPPTANRPDADNAKRLLGVIKEWLATKKPADE